MPPALHPRSNMTMSLFTGTLAVSFLVVGIPHLVPCPVPPQSYADDGTPLPRRRRRKSDLDDEDYAQLDALIQENIKQKRQCPVPKPGGLIGQLLGMGKGEEAERPLVRVQKLEMTGRRIASGEGDGDG